MNKIDKFLKFLEENNYLDEIKIKDNEITVGGSLYLSGTQIKELPENLTVGGCLYLSRTQIQELPENLTVGEYLDLSETQIKELPDNLTVGGSLNLSRTQIKELPDNLTVGGSLYLSGTQIKELPDNLMVEGQIYYFNNNILNSNKVLRGYNKERNYIYFDNILWGNVKSVKQRDNITIYRTPLGYCAVEEKLSAHGRKLKEAIEDLTFKKLRNTDTSKLVEEIKNTGKVTRLQYRAITGACRAGTEAFCNRNNIKEEQEEISLEELEKILIPGKDYGAEEFWNLMKRGDSDEQIR